MVCWIQGSLQVSPLPREHLAGGVLLRAWMGCSFVLLSQHWKHPNWDPNIPPPVWAQRNPDGLLLPASESLQILCDKLLHGKTSGFSVGVAGTGFVCFSCCQGLAYLTSISVLFWVEIFLFMQLGQKVLFLLTLLRLNMWKRKSFMVALSPSGWNVVPDTWVV